MRRAIRIVIAVVSVLALVAVGFLVWANIVFAGDREAALEVWRDDAVTVTSTDASIVMTPTDDATGLGLVFIPGAKVDPYAYMRNFRDAVADEGLTVVITKPTLNLAFFDTRPLHDFTDPVPSVTSWMVGGHSLGGVRACQLVDAVSAPPVDGLVLFGSYCANDISESGIPVLSISGSNDGLSTPEKIEAARPLLPADAFMVELDGANHADFGDYGPQPGDGVSTMPRDEVRDGITAGLATIVQFAG
ncbi:alpha/beta hydrolase [Agromyces atrinae]|uniref:alpha/beta hydrolase n=1 Tax=Agromyces atrinae TaxID=592376 RepID=UPI001F55EA6E|nr:alpha/beta hydrolase [Agromyces atrinae]MCI2956188.1 alpha/beta hydrolase [Agromyces atrinae]